jgi:hypothetical protein
LEGVVPQQLAFADGSQQVACSDTGQQDAVGGFELPEVVWVAVVSVVVFMCSSWSSCDLCQEDAGQAGRTQNFCFRAA